MTSFILAATLLAGEVLFATGNLGAASRRTSRAAGGQALVWLAVAVGIIAAVCVAIRLGSRLLRRRRYNSHGSLFNGLCRTHGLDHRARGLLKRAARYHKLAQPARVFTEPKWLDPAELKGSLRRRAAEVAILRNRLFA